MLEAKIYYGYIYLSTALMTYTFLLNHIDKYFSPTSFRSFYPKVRDFFSSVKIYGIIALYALVYQLGVFVISLPLSSIIVMEWIDNPKLNANAEIVICFLLNIAFVPILPTIYYIIVAIFSNSLTKFIQNKLESKLGISNNEFKEGISSNDISSIESSKRSHNDSDSTEARDIHITIKGEVK